jgi:hypothetical protein
MTLTTQFYIDPSAGVMRSTSSGDSAVSPTNQADVIFDAYGSRYGGASVAQQIPWSSFSGPVSYNPPNASYVKSAYYYSYQYNFATPYAYIPLVFASYQDPATDDWVASYNSGTVTYVTSGGVITPRGTGANSGFFATTSYIFLFLSVINFANPTSWTSPQAYAFRTYGL